MKIMFFILLSAITACQFETVKAADRSAAMKKLRQAMMMRPRAVARTVGAARAALDSKQQKMQNISKILHKHIFVEKVCENISHRYLFRNDRHFKEVACIVNADGTVLVSGVVVRGAKYTIDNSSLIKTLRTEGVNVTMQPPPLFDPSETEVWIRESQAAAPSSEADIWRVLTAEEIKSLARLSSSPLAEFPSYRFGIIKKSDTENLQQWIRSQAAHAIPDRARSTTIEPTFNEKQNNIGNNVLTLLRCGVPYSVIARYYDMVELFVRDLPQNLGQFFSGKIQNFSMIKEIWTLLCNGIPFEIIAADYEHVHKYITPIFFNAKELSPEERQNVIEKLKRIMFKQGAEKVVDSWKDILNQLEETTWTRSVVPTQEEEHQMIIEAWKIWDTLYH